MVVNVSYPFHENGTPLTDLGLSTADIYTIQYRHSIKNNYELLFFILWYRYQLWLFSKQAVVIQMIKVLCGFMLYRGLCFCL